MTSELPRCRLLDLQGIELSTATCRFVPGAGAWTAVLCSFDCPGQVVQRCLLGPLRDVWLEFAGGFALSGKVEQVSYDPEHGRVCSIRLAAGPLLPPPLPSGYGTPLAARARSE